MRETLKALHDDLEDMTTYRPAWKKDRHILTPDIDTQVTPLGLSIYRYVLFLHIYTL